MVRENHPVRISVVVILVPFAFKVLHLGDPFQRYMFT